MGKPGESATVKPSSELAVISAQAIYPKVKFFAAEKERTADVLLDEIGL
jgi:hypothetical protein